MDYSISLSYFFTEESILQDSRRKFNLKNLLRLTLCKKSRTLSVSRLRHDSEDKGVQYRLEAEYF